MGAVLIKSPSRSSTQFGRFDIWSYLWYDSTMSSAKVAISIDEQLLRRVDKLVKEAAFRSRSEVIQKAVAEKLARMDRRRLAQECAKLDPIEEQTIADEGIATDAETWPEY
jgi:Arc/MetJ-type ribon-helix-helix transcriptional regulator